MSELASGPNAEAWDFYRQINEETGVSTATITRVAWIGNRRQWLSPTPERLKRWYL